MTIDYMINMLTKFREKHGDCELRIDITGQGVTTCRPIQKKIYSYDPTTASIRMVGQVDWRP